MTSKFVLALGLAFILFGVLGLAFNVHEVKAQYPTVYIRADGSIYPSTANITSADNVTYTFTADINAYVVVERDNIVVNGAGYTIQGPGSRYETGIDLHSRNNVTLQNIEVTNFFCGIYLSGSSNNSLASNTASNNVLGIWLWGGSDNTIVGNTVSNNGYVGFYLYNSSNNVLFHNNFIDNANNVEVSPANPNALDNGLEGNYWSNYTGVDVNHDGIGNTPHVIDENNTDYYPLMGKFHSCDVFWIYPGFTVTLVSNSTVSHFNVGIDIEHPENRIIIFDATGETGYSFGRLCISKDLMAPPYTVVIDNGETPVLYYNETVFDNSTHRWIYFAYQHSEHRVIIIPEFPSFLILPLFMMATLLAALACRRERNLKT